MISKNQVRHIVSLHQQKFRKELKQFLAEGPKVVGELLNSQFRTEAVFATADWIAAHAAHYGPDRFSISEITPEELQKISTLVTPNQVLAIASAPSAILNWGLLTNGLNLMLDAVRDPGNLGTIIRLADWFGIGQIICSHDSVDVYNPKVIQAAMGSAFRVNVCYENLNDFLADLPKEIPVYGAFLEGSNISTLPLKNSGVIVIGSESHGISPEVAAFVTDKLYIPSYQCGHPGTGSAESLNASIATAILLYEFRRQQNGSVQPDSICGCGLPHP